MKVVIGLGNPGKKYVKTRHNVGFMAVDKFVEEHNVSFTKRCCKAIVVECSVDCEDLIVAKPLTFMNASGEAVKEIVERYCCNLDDIFVILDDINLPLGKIRIRKKGSSGGHNGLKSISDHLKTTGFSRLRIGIGNSMSRDMKDFVLSRFTKEEKIVIDAALGQTSNAINLWVNEGIDNCMNMFN